MANWYYYDANGNKIGPIPGSVLKQLAASGVIVCETTIETETGKKSTAGKVQGLEFAHEVTMNTSSHAIASTHAAIQPKRVSTKRRIGTIALAVFVLYIIAVVIYGLHHAITYKPDFSNDAEQLLTPQAHKTDTTTAATITVENWLSLPDQEKLDMATLWIRVGLEAEEKDLLDESKIKVLSVVMVTRLEGLSQNTAVQKDKMANWASKVWSQMITIEDIQSMLGEKETIVPTQTTAKEWYEGGTLHKATVAEWGHAGRLDKLATAADWISACLQKEGKLPKDMEVMELMAMRMVSELDRATEGLPDAAQGQPVADMAVLIWLSVKDEYKDVVK